MNNKTSLSIIVPCYNVEEYLCKCLNSLVELQLSIQCQIICINDGSTDDTFSILESYTNKISNYIIINQENKGLSNSRNVGLHAATSEWILFVDGDDFISTEGLKKVYKDIQTSGVEVCCCEYYDYINNLVSKRKEVIQKIDGITGVEFLNKYYFKSVLSVVWRYIYKRMFLLQNNLLFTDGVYFEDMEFTPKVLVCTNKMMYLNVPIYYYRQRQYSIMNSIFSEKKFNDSLFIAKENLNLILKNKIVKEKMLKSAHYIILRSIFLFKGSYKDVNYETFNALIKTAEEVGDKFLLIVLFMYKFCPKLIKIPIKLIRILKNKIR